MSDSSSDDHPSNAMAERFITSVLDRAGYPGSALAVVRGEASAGKTALLRQFCEAVVAQGGTVLELPLLSSEQQWTSVADEVDALCDVVGAKAQSGVVAVCLDDADRASERTLEVLIACGRRVSALRAVLVVTVPRHLEPTALGVSAFLEQAARDITIVSFTLERVSHEGVVLPEGLDPDLAAALTLFEPIRLSDLELVADVRGLALDDVCCDFDRLLFAEVLAGTPETGYAFTDPLLEEALRRTVNPSQARALHGSMSALLEARRESKGSGSWATIARHAVLAAPGPDERAAQCAERAGTEVLRDDAESGATWYRRAVELTPDSGERRAHRLGQLSRALLRSGKPGEGVETGRDALEAMPRGRDRNQLVSSVIEGLIRAGDAAGALVLIETEEHADDEARAGSRLMAHKISCLTTLGRFTEAEVVAQQVIALPTEDVVAQALSLAHAAQLADAQGHYDFAGTLLDRLMSLAPALPLDAQRFLFSFSALVLATEHRIDHAETVLARARQLAGDAADRDERIETAAALIEYARGDWDSAFDRAQRQLTALTTRPGSLCEAQLAALAANILLCRGDIAGARAAAERIQPDSQPTEAALCGVLAWSALLDQRPAEGIEHIERGLALSAQGTPQHQFLAVLRAHARHQLGDEDGAREALLACSVSATGELGPVLHGAALLIRAEITKDVNHAILALEVAESAGLPFDAAIARTVLGELDIDPSNNLTQAWRSFREMGAELWRRRAAAALRARGLPVPRKRAGQQGLLTETEQQLVQLLQEGLSNKEIAERMSYSARTVQTYLSRIYAKTGLVSRHSLALALEGGQDSEFDAVADRAGQCVT